MDLKQSTAATLAIGPCLDPDGVEYTGLVIGDLTLTKNGTGAALASAATLTHVANGHYTLVMTTGNTDTLGRWQLHCNKSGYQFPSLGGMVLSAATYDAIVTNAAGSAGAIPVVGSEMGVNASGANKIADTTLRRNMDNVEASSNGDTLDVNSLYGSVQQSQKSSIASGTLTIEKTDGTTLGTLAVASDAAAEPITGVGG